MDPISLWMARQHRRSVNICDTCGCLHDAPMWTCRSCAEAIIKIRMEQYDAFIRSFTRKLADQVVIEVGEFVVVGTSPLMYLLAGEAGARAVSARIEPAEEVHKVPSEHGPYGSIGPTLEDFKQALATSTRIPTEILFQDYFPVGRPLIIPPLPEEPTKRLKQRGPKPRSKWWLR